LKTVHEQIWLVVHVPVLLSQVATFWWSDEWTRKERASSKQKKLRDSGSNARSTRSPC